MKPDAHNRPVFDGHGFGIEEIKSGKAACHSLSDQRYSTTWINHNFYRGVTRFYYYLSLPGSAFHAPFELDKIEIQPSEPTGQVIVRQDVRPMRFRRSVTRSF